MTISVTPIPITSLAHSALTGVSTSQHHVATVVDTTRIFEEGGVQLGIFTDACPTGWSEYTTLRGRYPVGVPSGGTLEATVGTALSNSENRPSGQHTHIFSGTALGSHGHNWRGRTTAANSSPQSGYNIGSGTFYHSASSNVDFDFGAIKVLSAGTPAGTNAVPASSVAATNAPYVQLLFCTKD